MALSVGKVCSLMHQLQEGVGNDKQQKRLEEDPTQINGFIGNQHKVPGTSLKLYDQHTWFGTPTTPYFEVLPWDQPSPTWFKLEGPLPGGCKAGLVYTDGVDSTARKWVVAFDSVNQKAYVDAGPIGPTDWNHVEVKLNNSSNRVYYQDPILGGKAEAEVATYGTLAMIARFYN